MRNKTARIRRAFIELLWIIILMWRCVCHRAGRMGWTSTHGRMQTTTSTRLLTALAFCSKLKLPFGGLNSSSWCARLFVTLKPPAGDVQSRHWRRSRVSSFSHQWASAADSQCNWGKGAATLRLLTLDNDLLCLPFGAFLNQNARFVLIVAQQQKHQEIERVEKWLKMVKKWDKYRNSEKASTSLWCMAAVCPSVTSQTVCANPACAP